MTGRLRASLERRLRRFDFRLHPVLAAGIGLGIVALLFPAEPFGEERHEDEEILARLLSPEPDFEHAPAFWLREMRKDSALWHQALSLCATAANLARPNCRLLITLADLAPADVVAPADPPASSMAPRLHSQRPDEEGF